MTVEEQIHASDAETGSASPAHRTDRGRLSLWLWRLAVPAIAVGLWQLASRLGLANRALLPSPSAVWDATVLLQSSGILWPNLRSTVEAALAALLLAALLGIPLGILLGMLPRTWTVLAPYLNALNSMPRIALAPVFIVAFGIGQNAKVALGFSVAVFIFLMNSRIGVLSANEEHRDLCATLGASRLELFTKLYVPVAIPAIFTALRLGIVFAMLGVVASEIIASDSGLGQLITSYSATLAMANVYALLLMIAIITSLLTMLIGAFENGLLGWQRGSPARSRMSTLKRPPRENHPSDPGNPETTIGPTGWSIAAPGVPSDLLPQVRQPAVEFRSVSIEFRVPGSPPNRVLADLSLDVPTGQLLAIIGASGCGKTTMLNLVSGLVTPTGGEVTVLGEAPRVGRADIGFMFARDALLPWRTARQNVELGLELQRQSRLTRHQQALQLLDLVHLSSAVDRYPGQLSQGMRQRVALARTWATDPELLLLDEPFAALDALTRTSVRDVFLDIWDNELHRKTVLFVTHDLTEALMLADRVITIARGSVQSDVEVPYGRPRDQRELMARTDYQALFDTLRQDLTVSQ
jgi:NitT/TauT family transport system ATP-binding protein